MRLANSFLLSLAAGVLPALVAAEPAAPPAYTVPAVPIGRGGGGHIPRTVGRLFEIDGKVQYFAGTNCWWLGNLLDDAEVELAISQMADVRLSPFPRSAKYKGSLMISDV
jgi:mannan endo-1,4-beta-mannosidase